MKSVTSLPAIIAGPIVRHCDENQVNFWLVTSQPVTLNCRLTTNETHVIYDEQLTTQCQQIPIGKYAYINLISLTFENKLPQNTVIYYDFTFITTKEITNLTKDINNLTYQTAKLPYFVIPSSINKLLHGSCRKPHFDSPDGLLQVDKVLEKSHNNIEQHPSLLMMSGDQVYCDDVAGPMLSAIHQIIERLELFEEHWQIDEQPSNITNVVNSTETLLNHSDCYYQRHQILPQQQSNTHFIKRFLSKQQPIFSSVNSENHLVTLSEVLAMYLLVWSPTLWAYVDIDQHSNINEKYHKKYQTELAIIKDFIKTLPNVRRALAHIPTYMIFDDHDITDDWNLTRGWEEAAYNNPFSKRVIGNSLVAYYLCQGWGNAPEKFTEINQQALTTFTTQGLYQQTEFIDSIYAFAQWHYHLNTSPKIVVLDTRTQRWRSESNANKPSGLMDWESLCSLQLELMNQPAVIMVSAAPIYGVKLIETVQRIFTFLGKPLMVDAENWMAHSGTANVILNIFRHHKTPPNFIILSGDVHYSFVYRITHRFIKSNSTILQITCSGIKNAFPANILYTLERLNYYLYGRYSPLNWFTKRRRMKVTTYKPNKSTHHSLYNGSGIGILSINPKTDKITAEVLTVENEKITFFEKSDSHLK